MMIVGFPEGTEVKWFNEGGGFRTGIVRARYYDPGQYSVDGQEIVIEVVGESPVYVIEPKQAAETDDGDVIVLDHTKVFREHMNFHT